MFGNPPASHVARLTEATFDFINRRRKDLKIPLLSRAAPSSNSHSVPPADSSPPDSPDSILPSPDAHMQCILAQLDALAAQGD